MPNGGAEAGADPALVSRTSSPQLLLQIAREYDRKGHLQETADAYEAAIRAADAAGDPALTAEALRRLAVVRHRRQETDEARALCGRSEALARAVGLPGLIAEALNTFGGFALIEERFETAREYFLRAEALARDPDLQGRIAQNLGTVASNLGEHAAALELYTRSLSGFLAAQNDHGCALAYHNLGAISLDLRRWEDAERYLRLSLQAVEAAGDVHLRGLAVLNRAEALLNLGRTREARIAAETAASIFDETHAPRELSDAYRLLGTTFRHAGELRRAQGKLQLAVEVAATARCAVAEAEASRELAIVLALQGRRDEALLAMNEAARALDRLKPAGPSAEPILAGDYPAGVRARGDLLGALDPSALAHAERVARGAAAVARELGYEGQDQARVRVGGFLHELEEDQLGDTLAWDVRPIVRCHRERRDGSGPAKLCGDAIPLDAEIVGIVDAYDGGAVSEAEAGRWWRPEVVGAFRRAPAG
jgi:tetratricopeptide (TPR) repeat protein